MADWNPEPPGTEVTTEYNVGDTVTLDNIECVIVYDAGSEQSWGRYLLVDKNHDLCYYSLGSDFVDDSGYATNKWGFEWGGYNTLTGVNATGIGDGLTNTNLLIALNLQADFDISALIWDKVKEFRSSYSDKWFLPSIEELTCVYNNSALLNNISFVSYPYYWSSSETTKYNVSSFNFKNGNESNTFKNHLATRSRLCRYATASELPPKPSKTTINITCGTIDSTIRYTINGSEPSESSTLYEGEFEVEAPTTIKAKGFKEGWIESDVVYYEVNTN